MMAGVLMEFESELRLALRQYGWCAIWKFCLQGRMPPHLQRAIHLRDTTALINAFKDLTPAVTLAFLKELATVDERVNKIMIYVCRHVIESTLLNPHNFFELAQDYELEQKDALWRRLLKAEFVAAEDTAFVFEVVSIIGKEHWTFHDVTLAPMVIRSARLFLCIVENLRSHVCMVYDRLMELVTIFEEEGVWLAGHFRDVFQSCPEDMYPNQVECVCDTNPEGTCRCVFCKAHTPLPWTIAREHLVRHLHVFLSITYPLSDVKVMLLHLLQDGVSVLDHMNNADSDLWRMAHLLFAVYGAVENTNKLAHDSFMCLSRGLYSECTENETPPTCLNLRLCELETTGRVFDHDGKVCNLAKSTA